MFCFGIRRKDSFHVIKSQALDPFKLDDWRGQNLIFIDYK